MELGARARFRTARIGLLVSILAIGGIAFGIAHGTLGDTLERLVGTWQNALARATGGNEALAGWRLYVVALGGGLVASLSPCILGMLPVNLSYIGASKLTSRRAAVATVATFIAGVILVNAVLGLFSSLFFAVFVQYRAYVNLGVGLLTALMGLWMFGAVQIRFPSVSRMPSGAGPFVVGIAFALVASPCASPVLVAVLAAASRDGSQLHGVVAMVLYSIGYTAVLAAASLSAGIAKASRRVLAHGELLTRVAAGTLVLFGVAYLWYGLTLLRA